MQENRLIDGSVQYLNLNNQQRKIMYNHTGTRNS